MTVKVMIMYGSDVWEQFSVEIICLGYHHVKIMSSGAHYDSQIHVKWFLNSWPTGHNVPHS